ncbi:MAG: cation:proton antiporter [Candidatus Nanohaloarchaea archaeon]
MNRRKDAYSTEGWTISELVTILGTVFIAASVFMLLLNRLTIVTVPAYVLAGLAISGIVPESQMISLSQAGIAFLVFVFGAKTDIERLSSVARESIATTVAGITAVSVPVYIIGSGLGLGSQNSLYLAIAAGLSSSLVGLELIENEISIDLLHGRLSESIQLTQDMVAVLLVTLLASSLTYESIATHMLYLAVLVGAALFFRSQVFSNLEKLTGGSRELTMLSALASLTAFIGLGELLGTSIVVSAFAAGLSMAKFPQNTEVLETVGPLKDFFSAIFFVSLGALVTVPGAETILLTAVLLAATAIVKPVVNGLLLMGSGYDRRTSYLAGLSLDQMSEFALIISIQAYAAGTIAQPVFQSIIITATVTMVTSSYTSKYAEKIYDLTASIGLVEVNSSKINQRTEIPEDLSGHILLLGYDTQGREIAETLQNSGRDFVVLENDPEKIMEASETVDYYIFGDAMDSETWRKARVSSADLVISTVPQEKISEKILGLETGADIVLRAEDIPEAKNLIERGATYVNVPEILFSEELIDHIRGVMEDINYREELRRRNLLELRKELNPGEYDEEV